MPTLVLSAILFSNKFDTWNLKEQIIHVHMLTNNLVCFVRQLNKEIVIIGFIIL